MARTRQFTLRAPTPDYMAFEGGLDQVTPSIRTKPGTLRESQNIEIDINSGYLTPIGYERFDGQPTPSDAVYAILDVTITGSISDMDVITGLTSSATATVVAVVTNVTQNYLVITKITGTFNASEDLQVSAVTEANTDATQVIDGASTNILNAQYRNLAADTYRSDIAAVPGSGKILGIWMLNDIDYAFRNNAGGTAAALYKSSAAGWVSVGLGRELAFTSGGTTEIEEGQVLTGLIGGATATLTRVLLESGSWAAGTAVGKFIFATQTGTFEAEGVEVAGSGDLATIASDSSAITLLPGGRFEIINSNFGGEAGVSRMYGCDRVNRGFEFDGTVFCPIDTGMTIDAPNHVVVFTKHLFFAFGGSAQHSGIGTPYSFTLATGAAELAVGDTITGFKIQPGQAGNATLAIFSRNRINMLYGTSAADWNLADYREEIGAYAHSIQEIGVTMMLDDRGVNNLLAVQAYGNFQHNTVSRLIQPWINERKYLVNASCISREKSQYRLFFSDNYALYLTMENRKVIGMTPMLFADEVECCYSMEDSTGREVIKFGSSNGMVYQMEKGTSHDGEAIEWIINLHFHHAGTPRVNKSYKNVSFEIAGNGYAEFTFSYELGYASTDIPQPGPNTEIVDFSATKWDAFTWDSFFWDGVTLRPSSINLDGSAENISLILRGNSDYFSPILFSSALMHYLPRRQLR